MIRWIACHPRELNNARLSNDDGAPIEDPIDAAPPIAPLESVICSGIGRRQNIAKREVSLFGGIWGTGKNCMTGGTGRAVEIPTQYNRPIGGARSDERLDDFRAIDLNGFGEVQMGCRANQFLGAATETPYGTLSRPAAFHKPAGDGRRRAEEKMFPSVESPWCAEADNVVLPEGRCGTASADDVMVRQAFTDEVNLKIVGFLKQHEVAGMAFKEFLQDGTSMRPILGAVVGQAEAEIQRQDGKGRWRAAGHDCGSISNWRIKPVRSA